MNHNEDLECIPWRVTCAPLFGKKFVYYGREKKHIQHFKRSVPFYFAFMPRGYLKREKKIMLVCTT